MQRRAASFALGSERPLLAVSEREFRAIHLPTATMGWKRMEERAGCAHDINVVGLTLPERAIILAILPDARLDGLKRHSGEWPITGSGERGTNEASDNARTVDSRE